MHPVLTPCCLNSSGMCCCSCRHRGCRRAGKDPVEDSRRHPLQGAMATAVTGELVCVRQAPDLEALRAELQPVLDAGRGGGSGAAEAIACNTGPARGIWKACWVHAM